ncbi:transposase [Myroides guanonis]|uniref:transposase n=1 Tax=Myroides guanonis TaxID=1150112 RepID=UPI00373FC789
MFLKIYLYCYLTRLRSSRKLEKECLEILNGYWKIFVPITTASPISEKTIL